MFALAACNLECSVRRI